MSASISEMWSHLSAAGLPEVMLYLPDGSASRCHWSDTTLIGEQRVALLGDQERGTVRIIPVDTCVGLGIASPKGTDPIGYRSVVLECLRQAVATRATETAGSLPAQETGSRLDLG